MIEHDRCQEAAVLRYDKNGSVIPSKWLHLITVYLAIGTAVALGRDVEHYGRVKVPEEAYCETSDTKPEFAPCWASCCVCCLGSCRSFPQPRCITRYSASSSYFASVTCEIPESFSFGKL
jgi:hypothetical protein